MSAHFLSAEGLIKARLRDKVPDLAMVLGASDQASMDEAQQVTPAAHVLLDSYQPGNAVAPHIVPFSQVWHVYLCVRDVRDATGEAAREDAGPLLSAIYQALLGWKPSEDHAPLGPAPHPKPLYRPGGFVYLALAFTTRVIVRGTP